MGMHTIGGERRHTQYRMAATGVPYALGVTGARCGPLRHLLELDAPDHRLQLGHPPVGTEALMQPAKARRMLALIHRFPALAVVLVRPHARPQLAVIGGHHAALTTGGHDLVLAERPAAHVPDGADRPALVASPMGLCAVLDHMQTALPRQLHDRVHVAGPT